MSNTNVLQLKTGSGDVLYTGNSNQEPPLTPGENNSNVAPPFNAYSGSGEAKVCTQLPYDYLHCNSL